jgi:amino acid adenylation domain-containing protein
VSTADVYVLPASYAQERMWFLDELEPGSSAYIIPMAVRLRGALDVAALRRALHAVVARHESLRTTIADVDGDGRPRQVVTPEPIVELPLIDLFALPEGDRQAHAEALADAEAAAPFDLATGPLLRVRLVRLAPGDQVLLVSMHHVITDGWSIGIFVRELGVYYHAALRGEEVRLPDLPIQYADYAVWQRDWLRGDQLTRELTYWSEQLAGAPALLGLPTDRPRPAMPSFRGASVPFHWPAELRDRLHTLGHKHGATPFMVLLAGFTAMLARYSGGQDVVVGTPVAGRTRPELEGLIGVFVNTLALRIWLDDDPGFGALLVRVRETCLSAYTHQDLPFERLVEALRPERSLSHNPLVQVLFVLQNTPEATGEWPGLEATPVRRAFRGATAKFDLSLVMYDTAAGLEGGLEYNADLFAHATAERMLAHLRTLLEAAVAAPDVPVSRLPLLAPGERRAILDLGSAPVPSAVPRGIHELFADQVRRTPDATALVYRSSSLTFRELDASANRLARRLRELGVVAGALVGLCLERSPDLVVAMLAVLKAGAGYLPLDPAYPAERLALMLEDAKASLVVTREGIARRLPATEVPQLCLHLDDPPITRQAADPLPAPVVPGRLAYVLYTSGSTGRPKGVMITHDNVAALLDWARTAFPPAARAGVLASTSVCFDLSVFEIFLPLCWGGSAVLVDNALELLDGVPTGVTLVNTVPSVLGELLRLGGLPSTVDTVCLAGEPLAQSLVDEVHRCDGVERVYNLYGPSEATTYSTAATVEPSAALTPAIGRPITGTRVHVLDRWLEPVPVGVASDLYIGGAGVARGYLLRPGLTAERFVPDPFGSEPGARLYRTGDLARWRPDGELAFVGRLDHQVKLRGFRIELGEIEAVLRDHPAVLDAVLLAREDNPGDKRLVAYVVPRGEIPKPGLRAHCAARLPDYMVPATVVLLDELPLNPNGKIDRTALPAPGQTRTEPATSYLAPRTLVESAVADVWQEVLDVWPVGVHDNFFALGGHSLLATQVVARLRATFAVDLPLRTIFEARTVAELAEALQAAEPQPGHVSAIAELRHHIDSMSPEEILAHLNEE